MEPAKQEALRARAIAGANPFLHSCYVQSHDNPELAEQYDWQDAEGLVVTEVEPDGPAAAAGMEVGDLITRTIKDRAIAPVKSLDDLKGLADSDEIAVYVEDVNKRLPGQFMSLRKAEDQPQADDNQDDGQDEDQ